MARTQNAVPSPWRSYYRNVALESAHDSGTCLSGDGIDTASAKPVRQSLHSRKPGEQIALPLRGAARQTA